MGTAIIRQDGDKVLLVIDGKAIVLPWDGAIEIGQSLVGCGRKAEEIAKADQVAFDHAIAVRLALPFGFAFNPDVRKLGEQEAANNTQLRRYLPGGIKSEESMGTPTVRRRPR